MSPGTGCARSSSFTSLRQAPDAPCTDAVWARLRWRASNVSGSKQSGVLHSEVKEEAAERRRGT